MTSRIRGIRGISIGDKFCATIRKGQHSKTFKGKEGAGRVLGPFIVSKVYRYVIEAGSRVFDHKYFAIKKELL